MHYESPSALVDAVGAVRVVLGALCISGSLACGARCVLLWHRALIHRERGVGAFHPHIWFALTQVGAKLRNRGILYWFAAAGLALAGFAVLGLFDARVAG